jgi:hypothetical protein
MRAYDGGGGKEPVMTRILVVLMVCGLGPGWIASSASADNSRGVCNSIVGQGLGEVFRITHDAGGSCEDVLETLVAFNDAGCFALFDAGELALNRSSLLGNDPERLSPLGTAVCTVLVQDCGFGALLPPGTCEGF